MEADQEFTPIKRRRAGLISLPESSSSSRKPARMARSPAPYRRSILASGTGKKAVNADAVVSGGTSTQ